MLRFAQLGKAVNFGPYLRICFEVHHASPSSFCQKLPSRVPAPTHHATIARSVYCSNVTARPLNATRNTYCIRRRHTASDGLPDDSEQRSHGTFLLYCAAFGIFMIGVTYLMVPLYKIFCQQFGLGGLATESQGHKTEIIPDMNAIRDRPIKVNFRADVNSKMKWNFRPVQSSVTVYPGETALAFFKARNPTSKAITGVATYNVEPVEAGVYFNKIQCFCFEEQRLNPNEEIDMPVFFFIDPEFDMDANLLNVDDIILSYHFFEAKPGMEIPLPGFMQQPSPPVEHAPAT